MYCTPSASLGAADNSYILSKVLPDVHKKAKEEHESESARGQHLEKWWMHWRHRADMKSAIRWLRGRYITGSRTQRWPFVFSFVSSEILPGDKLQVFAFDDDYSIGILQSKPHLLWYQAKAARLKHEEDYNYSVESVFDTYPWPQKPKTSQIASIAVLSREIRKIRASSQIRIGLRGLYHTLELPGNNPLKMAHAELDAAVIEAYGFSARQDLLEQLLSLNQKLAQPLVSKQMPTAPGIPLHYPNPERLVTNDVVWRDSRQKAVAFYACSFRNVTRSLFHGKYGPSRTQGNCT